MTEINEHEESGFTFEKTEEELRSIEIIRPLEIGYERLPEGITALDFIEYEPVRSSVAPKYSLTQLPQHPLLADLAVPSLQFMLMQPRKNTQFYNGVLRERVSSMPWRGGEKTEYDDFIAWHLVREPECSTSSERHTRRAYEDMNNLHEKIQEGEILPFVRGLDKLMEHVD